MIPNDTSKQADEVQMRLLRSATPSRRLAIALRLSDETRRLARRAIARSHPDWTPAACDVCFARVHFGETLARGLAAHLEKHGSA